MSYARWGWACWAFAALVGAACGSESKPEPQGGAGGDSAGAGAGGDSAGSAGGSGEAGGSGGDTTRGCVEHSTCDEWGANFYCPERIADLQTICELSSDIEVESSSSDCGGTVVHATNGVQDVRYSFDADGKLIGVIAMGDVGDCDVWGTRCQPLGSAEALCNSGGAGSGSGGAGGGDMGGAGGEGGGR